MVGATYPSLESICRKCGNGILLVKEIQQKPSKDSNLRTESKKDVAERKNVKLSLNEVNGEASQNDSPGGNQILTSFHNRISTVVVIVQLMNEIADKERVLQDRLRKPAHL